MDKVMSNIMETIEDGLVILQKAEHELNDIYSYPPSTTVKLSPCQGELEFDFQDPLDEDDILNFIEKTINDALDTLQSDEVEDNKSPPIEEEKDSEFISNSLGEEPILSYMLKQIDDGLSSLQRGENEPSSGSAPSEDVAPLDKDGAFELIDRTLKDALEILNVNDSETDGEVDIHKKMGGSDDLSLLHEITPAGSKLQTRPTRGTDDMPFGEDICEENPLPDKENTPSSPLFASRKEEKISNKTLTRKKRDDNSWIKEHPKEPQPSPPPISSLKGFTRKKREDGSWIRGGSNTVKEAKESQPSPPPVVVREQTEGEEAEGSQPGYGYDVTRSIKTLKFREKLEFWKQKEARH